MYGELLNQAAMARLDVSPHVAGLQLLHERGLSVGPAHRHSGVRQRPITGDVAVAHGSGFVALVGNPAPCVSQPRVSIEAVPTRELRRVAFEHGAEPSEGAAAVDRLGEARDQVVVDDGGNEQLQVAIPHQAGTASGSRH